jgi:two-component system response regulator
METTRGNVFLILLVEDNTDHADPIKRNLAGNRVANRIVWVEDGEKALHYLFHEDEYTDPATSLRPNLILLDLRLPRVDGLEVLRRIKQDNDLHKIPVMVLTSSAAGNDIRKSYDYLANRYIVKPVDRSRFNQLMDELGFYWLRWNQKLRD